MAAADIVPVSEVVADFLAAATPRQQLSVLVHVLPVYGKAPAKAVKPLPGILPTPVRRVQPLPRDEAATKANMDTVATRMNDLLRIQGNRIEGGLVFVVSATASQISEMREWGDVIRTIGANKLHKVPPRRP